MAVTSPIIAPSDWLGTFCNLVPHPARGPKYETPHDRRAGTARRTTFTMTPTTDHDRSALSFGTEHWTS